MTLTIEALQDDLNLMPKDKIRERIKFILDAMDKAFDDGVMVKVETETTHHFTDDAYCREAFANEGTLIVGKVHHHEHFLFVLEGEALVLSEEGLKTVEAPKIIISKPGSQRVLYAMTDIRWAGVFPTKERNIDKLEKELFSDNYESYLIKEGIFDVLPKAE